MEKKVCAVKCIIWDAFNPEHACCLSIMTTFRDLGLRPSDGAIVLGTLPCPVCGKNWSKIVGGSPKNDCYFGRRKPHLMDCDMFYSEKDVPDGWIVIPDP